MRRSRLALGILATALGLASFASPQRIAAVDIGWIRTIGGSNNVGDGGPAREAYLPGINAVATDSSGRFIMANDDFRIRRIENDGTLTVIAGNGARANSAPSTGSALTALPDIRLLTGLADGSLMAIAQISTGFSFVVLRFDTAGNVTAPTLTPTAKFPGALSGLAQALSADPAGNVYYLDSVNGVVTKISTTNELTRVAGVNVWPPATTSSGDGGLATDAALANTNGLLVSNQEIFVVEEYGRIRKVNAQGIISTVTTGLVPIAGEQPAQLIRFVGRKGDGSFVAQSSGRLYSFSPGTPGTSIAGSGSVDPENANNAASASFWNGTILATMTTGGDLVVAVEPYNLVYRITTSGSIGRVAGRLPGAGSSMNFPIRDNQMAPDSDGSFLTWSYSPARTQTIFRYRPNRVERIAGTTRLGSSPALADGQSVDDVAMFSPSVAPGCDGNTYVTYLFTPPYLFRVDANRIAHAVTGPPAPPFTRFSTVAGQCGGVYAIREQQLFRINADDTATLLVSALPNYSWMRSDDAGGLLAADGTALRRIAPDGMISSVRDGWFLDAVSDRAGGFFVLRIPPGLGNDQAILEHIAPDETSTMIAQNSALSLAPQSLDGPLTSNRLRIRALAWDPTGFLTVLDGGLLRQFRVGLGRASAPAAPASTSAGNTTTMPRTNAPQTPGAPPGGGRPGAPQAG